MQTKDITLASGEVITIKPVSWKNLDDLSILLSKVIEQFILCKGAVGTLLKPSNKEVWGHIEKIAAMIPIVGKLDKGINLEQIEDISTIVSLFITKTINVDEDGWVTREDNANLEPSLIAEVNAVDFYQILIELREKMT